MFGSKLMERRSRPERIADLADGTSGRVGTVADEAWLRASRAYDALAGRRPAPPWGWLVGAGLVGAAIGWAAATAARAAATRAEQELRAAERVEFVDMDRAASPVAG